MRLLGANKKLRVTTNIVIPACICLLNWLRYKNIWPKGIDTRCIGSIKRIWSKNLSIIIIVLNSILNLTCWLTSFPCIMLESATTVGWTLFVLLKMNSDGSVGVPSYVTCLIFKSSSISESFRTNLRWKFGFLFVCHLTPMSTYIWTCKALRSKISFNNIKTNWHEIACTI